MSAVARSMTTRIVLAWTRLYTHGLPASERAARLAEIESDLWEFEHDSDTPRSAWAGAHVVMRLLIGIPDDLAWRIETGSAAGQPAAIEALAAASTMTSPRRVSAFGIAATLHVLAISGGTWIAAHDPLASVPPGQAIVGRMTGRVVPGRPPSGRGGAPSRVAFSTTSSSTRAAVRSGRSGAPALAVAVATVATSNTPSNPATRAVEAIAHAATTVREAAVAVATRMGLMAPARATAPTQLPVIGSLRQGSIAPGSRVFAVQTTQPATPVDRFTARVLENRYAISVHDGQLAGTGAEVLQNAMAQSRFVLMGEDHGIAQTPQFGAALCNAAGADRFHVMAIEEGPLVAAELERSARRPSGLADMTAFVQKFPYAVGAAESREEFAMVQQCAAAAQGEFHLWGVNHEGLGGAGLILSRIFESRLGPAARPAMQELSQKNDDASAKAIKSGSIADLYMLAANDQDLARGSAALQIDGSPEARSLFASLVESHEINRRSPADYDNARRRERFMKTAFASAYARAAKSGGTPPKVLVKVGGYHIYRGLNPVHGVGIGNYVAEFAEAQNAQSLHIRLMPMKSAFSIRPRVGQPPAVRRLDYDDDPRSKNLQSILGNRLDSDWTLFDLRALRHDFNGLGSASNADLATLVFGVDLLILVPEGTPATPLQ